MPSITIDVDISDLDLDDDDILDICEHHGFSCKKVHKTETLCAYDIATILNSIKMRIWQPDDWERLQNAVDNAVIIPKRRVG